MGKVWYSLFSDAFIFSKSLCVFTWMCEPSIAKSRWPRILRTSGRVVAIAPLAITIIGGLVRFDEFAEFGCGFGAVDLAFALGLVFDFAFGV